MRANRNDNGLYLNFSNGDSINIKESDLWSLYQIIGNSTSKKNDLLTDFYFWLEKRNI